MSPEPTAKYQERTLSISLRPRTLDEVVGLTDVVAAIRKQIASGRIPTGWLFSGPPGVGKTTLAYIVARLVQGPDFPAGQEVDLVDENAADHGKVADARQFAEEAQYNPRVGRYRVVIMDEMQQATPEAQNVFLKLLEAEQTATLYIFCTTDPDKIIPALRGRCLSYRLRPLADADLKHLVVRSVNQLNATPEQAKDLIAVLINKEVRSPRDVLMAVERLASGMTVVEAVQTADDKPEYADIAKAVVNGQWSKARDLLKTLRAADVRGLRAVVTSFLSSALLDADSPKQAGPIRLALKEFDHSPFEDGVAFNVTKGALYESCRVIREAKN